MSIVAIMADRLLTVINLYIRHTMHLAVTIHYKFMCKQGTLDSGELLSLFIDHFKHISSQYKDNHLIHVQYTHRCYAKMENH